MLYTKIAANIEPLNARLLALRAIKSAEALGDGRDGISYLMTAKANGIATALSAEYEQEILREARAETLEEALARIRSGNWRVQLRPRRE